MIIRCPKCRTGYSVSNDQIYDAGRTVRCTQCKHTWHQDKVDNFMQPTPVTEQAPIAPSATSKAPAVKKKGLSKLHIGLISGFASLMVVFLLLWAVTGALPGTTQFMIALGFNDAKEETSSATGLIIPKESVERTLEDGEPLVMVYRGTLKNTNEVAVNVPKIIITLHDDKGVEIDRWPAYPEKKKLEAGEETKWICRFFNPDLDNVAEHRIMFK